MKLKKFFLSNSIKFLYKRKKKVQPPVTFSFEINCENNLKVKTCSFEIKNMSYTQLTTFYKYKYRKTQPKLEGKNIFIHIHNPHLAVYIKFVGKHKWHVYFFFIFKSIYRIQQKPKRNPILYILEITYLC